MLRHAFFAVTCCYPDCSAMVCWPHSRKCTKCRKMYCPRHQTTDWCATCTDQSVQFGERVGKRISRRSDLRETERGTQWGASTPKCEYRRCKVPHYDVRACAYGGCTTRLCGVHSNWCRRCSGYFCKSHSRGRHCVHCVREYERRYEADYADVAMGRQAQKRKAPWRFSGEPAAKMARFDE